ncbi:helix-turn-helix domain-containing protein [Actinacidiphila acidipaludis]|uniref:Helix-turn-helix domain-containing protein n=1 Tax=Actinacidiphila acidipaludis TaxID=2873382 RepID=A0ABS7Q997_9ACTN|nr:helix-turn-helix domain-containing protein [Streptomyces acidipaludis]MBY8878354.1 helix-turn-helix domain-containing protein [Streptomyces acidipaludis]
MRHDLLLALRTQRGLTQEELSERSGISVRTIRNLERGRIQSPRRSSLDLLFSVLDPDPRGRAGRGPAGAARPGGAPADHGQWRGPRPPRTSLIGRDAELDRLCALIDANPVTVLTGPGGVGKTRLALAAAERTAHRYPGGVAVVQLGRVPAATSAPGADVPVRLAAARQAVEALLGGPPAGPAPGPALLVLDTTEHLPQVASLLVEELRGARPEVRLLLTGRRPPALPEACLWETAPLPAGSALQLMRQRILNGCGEQEATAPPEAVEALCRELDGVPRLVEFAARRLRSVPASALLAPEHVLELLGYPDVALLPHQRSLLASMRWSWDMLTGRQQVFLGRLAAQADPVTVEGPELASLAPEFTRTEAMCLLAELADASLLQVSRGTRYEYRMLRHVRAFVRHGRQEQRQAVPLGRVAARL